MPVRDCFANTGEGSVNPARRREGPPTTGFPRVPAVPRRLSGGPGGPAKIAAPIADSR